MYKLYGVSGFGSAITELMLTLVEEPYKFIDIEGFDAPGPMRDRLLQVNPLAQVPTLVLEEGTVMTESAAIALWLLDRHPRYAPAVGTPERQQFYRLLVWIVANVYLPYFYLRRLWRALGNGRGGYADRKSLSLPGIALALV